MPLDEMACFLKLVCPGRSKQSIWNIYPSVSLRKWIRDTRTCRVQIAILFKLRKHPILTKFSRQTLSRSAVDLLALPSPVESCQCVGTGKTNIQSVRYRSPNSAWKVRSVCSSLGNEWISRIHLTKCGIFTHTVTKKPHSSTTLKTLSSQPDHSLPTMTLLKPTDAVQHSPIRTAALLSFSPLLRSRNSQGESEQGATHWKQALQIDAAQL